MELFDELTGIYYRDKMNWDVAFCGIFLMSTWFIGHTLWGRKKVAGKRTEWELLSLFKPRRRGKAMKRHRRHYVDSLIIDDVVDAIEKRVYNEEISREEATERYRKMKQLFPVRDLFPAPQLLKEAITRRMGRGTHDPVPLPGSAEEAKRNVPKRKHMFDKVKTA